MSWNIDREDSSITCLRQVLTSAENSPPGTVSSPEGCLGRRVCWSDLSSSGMCRDPDRSAGSWVDESLGRSTLLRRRLLEVFQSNLTDSRPPSFTPCMLLCLFLVRLLSSHKARTSAPAETPAPAHPCGLEHLILSFPLIYKMYTGPCTTSVFAFILAH